MPSRDLHPRMPALKLLGSTGWPLRSIGQPQKRRRTVSQRRQARFFGGVRRPRSEAPIWAGGRGPQAPDKPAWPRPSTRLKRIRADGAAGPGTWLRVTLAHRESIQAPHRPPTRRHEAGCGAIAVRARAQTAIIDRAPGTLNNRPDRSLVSARLGPLSLIGYEA